MMRMMIMKISSKLFEMCILENKFHMALYRFLFMVANLIHTRTFIVAALEKEVNLLATIDRGCLMDSGYRLSDFLS